MFHLLLFHLGQINSFPLGTVLKGDSVVDKIKSAQSLRSKSTFRLLQIFSEDFDILEFIVTRKTAKIAFTSMTKCYLLVHQ